MDLIACLRTFTAIVDTGSFTAAAERLALSRAVTSRHIADLEAHLGVRLLHRTTRRLHLTEAGSSMIANVRQILELVEEAERVAGDRTAEPTGLLRVSAPVSFAQRYLAPLVGTYLARHPAAAVDLSLNDRFVDLVEEGYDLAIRIGTLPDSSYLSSRLAQTRLHLAASPAYLKRHGTPKHLVDIAAHACLDYAHVPARRGWMFETPHGPFETQTLTTRVTSNNGDALVSMALGGAGLVYQPDFIIAEHVRTGRLALVLPQIAVRTIGIHAVHPAGRYVPRKTLAFIAHLRAAFKGVAPWSLEKEASRGRGKRGV